MADLTERVRPPFAEVGADLVASYGHSGNLAVRGNARAGRVIGSTLVAATGHEWAVISLGHLQEPLQDLDRIPTPTTEHQVRWTPGLVLSIDRRPRAGEVRHTERAVLFRLSPTVVGAFKRDYLDRRGRLDPLRRLGGWGAISSDVARQLGGTWTARSAGVLSIVVKGPNHGGD